MSAHAFRHRTTLDVRLSDTDSFGHVNNAVFATYAEQARIRYLRDVLEPDGRFDSLPLILARIEIDFRSPIFFGDALTAESRVDRIGRTSFQMSHRMTAGPEGRLVAEIGSVLVTYDYERAQPMPVPDGWRERMTAHEGRQLTAEPHRSPVAAGS